MNTPARLLLATGTLLGSLLVPAIAIPRTAVAQSSVSVTTSRGRLGAQVITISTHLRAFFGAPNDAGLLVDHVLPGSAASKAGLFTGDVIVAVNDQPTADALDIFRALSDAEKGDKINLSIVRNKKRRTLSVVLQESPTSHSFHWGATTRDAPFNFGQDWNPGMLFRDGKNFPFSPLQQGPNKRLQERVRQLEERLRKLEAPGRVPRKKGSAKKPLGGPQGVGKQL